MYQLPLESRHYEKVVEKSDRHDIYSDESRMMPSPQRDRATGTPPREYGEG